MHAGMGQQKLDASTGTKGCVKLLQADGKPIGQLSFDLDTHGYDFTRPGEWIRDYHSIYQLQFAGPG